jgi:plastocyanin
MYVQNIFAKTIEIKVVDANNVAVPNAVITVPHIPTVKQSRMEIMDQVDKQFLPYVLVIQQGQSVDFPNSDNVRHHVYSFSQPNQFEIKLFSGSEAQPISFESSGVVVLGCNIHDSMIGYIYVNSGELTVMTDNKGLALIDLGETSTSNEPIEMSIWHPDLSPMQTKRLQIKVPSNKATHDIALPFSLEVETSEVENGFKKKFGY